MKFFIMIWIGMITILGVTPVLASPSGKEGGNGGASIAFDVKTYGLKFVRYLETEEGKKLFPEIDPVLFYNTVMNTPIDVVRKKLRDHAGKLKTARNIRVDGEILIEVNRRAWRKDSKKPITQLRLSIHEYMVAGGFGGDAERLNYALTLRIDSAVAMKIITGVTLVTGSLRPIDAAEALLAEQEAKEANALQEGKASEKRAADALAQTNLEQEWKQRLNFASVPALRCAESLVKKRRGGKLSIDYAVAVLRKLRALRLEAEGTKDVGRLVEAREFCDHLKGNLKRIRTSRKEMIRYANQQKAAERNDIYDLVVGLFSPTVERCKSYAFDVSVGVVFGVNAGIGVTDCRFTNGTRWLGFGPQIGLNGGALSAAIRYTKATTSEKRGASDQYSTIDLNTKSVGRSPFVITGEVADGLTNPLILDLVTWEKIGESIESESGVYRQKQVPPGYNSHPTLRLRAIGVEFAGLKVTGGIRIPILPLERDWSGVLDKLMVRYY